MYSVHFHVVIYTMCSDLTLSASVRSFLAKKSINARATSLCCFATATLILSTLMKNGPILICCGRLASTSVFCFK